MHLGHDLAEVFRVMNFVSVNLKSDQQDEKYKDIQYCINENFLAWALRRQVEDGRKWKYIPNIFFSKE